MLELASEKKQISNMRPEEGAAGGTSGVVMFGGD